MTQLKINGKQYQIRPHAERRNVDLFIWSQYGENSKKRINEGLEGVWLFDSCYNDLEHLAKTLLNRATDVETVNNVQTLLGAWKNAVATITEALEAR